MRRAYLWTILLLLALAGALTACTLGEAELPAPSSIDQAAPRDAGIVASVPDPIPHSLDGREDCFTCHAIGAADAPAVPPDHEQDVQQCTLCHAVWTRPGIAAVAPPAIQHEVEGKEDCLTCHKIGTAGAPRVPDNHSGLPSAICLSCHVQGDEVAGGSVEAVSLAAAIPHGLEGFATCTLCHEQGGGGAPPFPANHAGRTDEICTACHSAIAPVVEEPTAAPTQVAAASSTATPEAAAPRPAAPPPVPHSLEGRTACSLCHERGGSGTPKYPPDHAGRSDSTCTACHIAPVEEPSVTGEPTAAPASTPSTETEEPGGTAPAVPHALEGRAACTLCHGGGSTSIPQFPADHAGRADSTCTACHQPSVAEPPVAEEPAPAPTTAPATGADGAEARADAIPHSIEGRAACTLCHGGGSASIPQYPEDHAGRADSTCLACHHVTTEGPPAPPSSSGSDLYAANCAICHGDQGQGGAVAEDPINTGEVLEDEEELREVIQDGEDSMPGFGSQLSVDEISALIEFMFSWLR